MSEKLTDSLIRHSPPAVRAWGFRFSVVDAIALLVLGAAAYGLYRLDSKLWWLVAIVAGHFFLFCNVFRVVRRRELICIRIANHA